MNSLLKHVSELDRFENIQKASVAGYAAAIESMAQYVIEVDPAFTERHREYLRTIRVQVMGAQSPEALMETQPALRSELRDYRDKCATHLTGLRQDFTSALLSLQDVMSSMSSSGHDQEQHLRKELNTLESLAEASDPQVLRRGVQMAVKNIAECVQQLKRENDIRIAQFRDEIRTMQSQIEAAEASAALDGVTGALKRRELESRVRRDVLRDAPVCLFILKVGNFREIASRHGKHLASEAMIALFRRTREQFGEGVDIGRWSDETFVVKLLCVKLDALKHSKELGQRTTGPYVCMEEGHRHTFSLRVNIGVTDFHQSEDGDRFLARVEQLCESIG